MTVETSRQHSTATRRIGTSEHQVPVFMPSSQCSQNTRSAAAGIPCAQSQRSSGFGLRLKYFSWTSRARGSRAFSIGITIPSPMQTISQKPGFRGDWP